MQSSFGPKFDAERRETREKCLLTLHQASESCIFLLSSSLPKRVWLSPCPVESISTDVRAFEADGSRACTAAALSIHTKSVSVYTCSNRATMSHRSRAKQSSSSHLQLWFLETVWAWGRAAQIILAASTLFSPRSALAGFQHQLSSPCSRVSSLRSPICWSHITSASAEETTLQT